MRGERAGKVVVAGSANMDVVARVKRHPAAGETVAGTDLLLVPGGKGANQAVASARLGAETILIGNVGTDAFGLSLYEFLCASGVSLEHLKRLDNIPTGTALIVVAENGENTIVVVPGANGRLAPEDVELVRLGIGDVLASQFEVPAATIEAFFRRGRLQGTTNILNPAPAREISRDLLGLCDLIVLNETELELLTGNRGPLDSAVESCKRLRAFSEQSIVLTLGKEGAIAVSGSEVIRVPGLKVTPVDSTGAGDCFVGAMASRLAAGWTLRDALSFANRAAAISVQRFGAGTSLPTLSEVETWTFGD